MRYKGAAFLAIALALLVPSTQLATSQSAVASTAAPTSKLKPNMFQANSVRRGGRASGPGAGPSSATKKEIIGRRSRNSRTYQSGGNFETLIYPASINYQDAKGNWQPIDDTLVAASNPAYAYQNKANSYTAFFPANLAASPIHFTGQAGFVDFSLVGARGAVAASHNQATYSNVLPGVSLSYAANADTLKESIRLDAPTAPNTFTFRLHTGPGLTARQMPGGAIEFLNAAGKPQYAFTLPYMYDSSNSAAGFSREVRMALGQDASGQTVTLTADPGWLKSNARKFPVTIDPSIGTNLNFYGGQDCFIQNTNPNTNFCSSAAYTGTADQVGYDGSAVNRTLLLFPVQTGYPDDNVTNSNILDAELDLTLASSTSGSAVAVTANPIIQSWNDNYTTWNNRDNKDPVATRKIIWRVVSGASIAVGLLAAIAGVISGRPATVVAGVGLAAFGLFSYQFSARL